MGDDEQSVISAIRRRIIRTLDDPTVAFLSVAAFSHIIVAVIEFVANRRFDALDIGTELVDAATFGQLIVRIVLDTIRMIRRNSPNGS